MKKIRSKKDLQQEKQRLQLQQQELEGKMRSNWNGLKEAVRPVNIVKDTVSSVLKTKTDENLGSESILKSVFVYGASVLVKKLMEKGKSARWFKKER
jgi:hypothetical protein